MSQFGVFIVCQIPFRFGLPSAVRGELYAWPAAAAVARPSHSATVNATLNRCCICIIQIYLFGEVYDRMPAMIRHTARILGMALAVCVAGILAAQQGSCLEVLQLRPNFYMIAGAGGNIGVQVGVDGVVVVDAGSAGVSDTVIAAIKKITSQPIRYIINTSADPDHIGGNAAIAKAGQTLFIRGGGVGIGADFLGGGASILSVEQVLTRMSGGPGKPSQFPVEA